MDGNEDATVNKEGVKTDDVKEGEADDTNFIKEDYKYELQNSRGHYVRKKQHMEKMKQDQLDKVKLKSKNAFLDELRRKKQIVEEDTPDNSIPDDSLKIIKKHNLMTQDAHNDNKRVHA